jgi:hypothetical protein
MKLALVAVVALAGCTEHVQLGADPFADVVALTVSPAATTIDIADLSEPARRIEYVATAELTDGSLRDVTSLVTWSTDNPYPGRFVSGGRYETSRDAAGHVAVSATAGHLSAAAALTVIITATVTDEAFPLPGDASALFPSGTPGIVGDPIHGPALTYPAPTTMFPQGLARILFQYRTGMANDAFRLRFDSDVLHLTVLTGSDRWLPDGPVWTVISSSHRGTDVTLAIDATASTAPGTIYTSTPVPLSFSRSAPGGALYFWSESAGGLVRTSLDASSSARLYPRAGDASCVGCHTISRDGRTIALGYGGEMLETLGTADLAVGIASVPKIPMGWATFSPDGTRLLIADKGNLSLRDASTGAGIGSPDGRIMLPGHPLATHPDWSPDGTQVAVALSTDVMNMDVKAASIAVIPVDGDTFGAPVILVPAGPMMDNNYFPRWSPDGRFLAYVNASSGSKGAKTAELRLIPATGGTPIRLRAASHAVGAAIDVPDLSNTLPTWGPLDGDRTWLAFTSARPYGAMVPTLIKPQIWIAGIDLSVAGDPSRPAFWLPSQDLTKIANTPVWSALPPPEP